MRTSVALLLVGLCAFALAGPTTQVDETGMQYRVADKVFLHKQKDILRLFKYVFQSNYYKDQAEIAQNYRIEEHMDNYVNHKIVKEFLHYYKQGFLPRGEVFSIFHEEHRQQAIALFHVLYYAKNWETFYQTACWAREYVNEGMFVYAMHVAVIHRHDMEGIILPPIYEIYPYFFVNSEVIDKAYEYKMKYGFHYQGNDKQQKYYIQANYTGWYMNSNPEQHDMAYYTEDVAVNAFYYYFNIDYPFWMGGEEYSLQKDRRGELYYFVHQQILAKYYMERLSNGYGSISVFNWEEPIKTGYVPSMRYPNGLRFPVRPAYAHLAYNPYNQAYTYTADDNVFMVQEIQDYERRIRDAIDRGFIMTEEGQKINIYEKEGFDMLGRMMQSNPDSPNYRFYGYLQVIAHQVLGYGQHPHHQYKIHASVLEHFETALRDPIFYQFYKRMTYYFLQYKSNLPSYTYTQLNYPGITVEGMTVDQLITYFDNFEFELTNALYVNEQEYESDDFQVWARQYRLNHQPFNFKINVQSDKATDVVVRVFLGPKYDEQGHEIPINENRVNFVEFDKFIYTLQAGKNVIERNSRQAHFIKDRTSYRALYQHVMAALEGKEEFHLDMSEAHTGFPNRFVLPMGTEEGQVYQFYVYVSPCKMSYEKTTFDKIISAGIGSGARYVDDMAFGYPLDRQIKYEHNFHVPNSHFEEVIVYHKTENRMGQHYNTQGHMGQYYNTEGQQYHKTEGQQYYKPEGQQYHGQQYHGQQYHGQQYNGQQYHGQQYHKTEGQQYYKTEEQYNKPEGHQYYKTEGQQYYKPEGQQYHGQQYHKTEGQQYYKTEGQQYYKPEGRMGQYHMSENRMGQHYKPEGRMEQYHHY